MGAGSSVTKYVEVSFYDKNTGKIHPEEKIIEISNTVCRQFDYPPAYYRAYKPDESGKNPYAKFASELEKK